MRFSTFLSDCVAVGIHFDDRQCQVELHVLKVIRMEVRLHTLCQLGYQDFADPFFYLIFKVKPNNIMDWGLISILNDLLSKICVRPDTA
jgi:hypothetical protein